MGRKNQRAKETYFNLVSYFAGKYKVFSTVVDETSEIDGEDVEFHCAQSHVNNDDYVECFVIETKL